MKKLLVITILIGWSCLSLAQTLPQAMVKSQPFPFPTGVALSTDYYGQLKANLQAADQLRRQADTAIASLEAEIAATRKALSDQRELSEHDFEQYEQLTGQLGQLQAKLLQAETLRNTLQAFVDKVLAGVPRSVRKQALASTDPGSVVSAYIDRLQTRKWKWAGAGSLAGVVGTLLLLIR